MLAALPAGLMFMIQGVSPGYMDPLFHGKGLMLLIGTGLSVLTGFFVIRRMVNIEV